MLGMLHAFKFEWTSLTIQYVIQVSHMQRNYAASLLHKFVEVFLFNYS